jgi:hypothetical protein
MPQTRWRYHQWGLKSNTGRGKKIKNKKIKTQQHRCELHIADHTIQKGEAGKHSE